jgi:hypothetical protein
MYDIMVKLYTAFFTVFTEVLLQRHGYSWLFFPGISGFWKLFTEAFTDTQNRFFTGFLLKPP